MKGIAVSDEEKRLHDLICSMGCVACRQDGIFNTHVSVHHVHGRTRPGSHMHVLPLCEPHHQQNSETLAVHGSKKRWEDRYGKQDDLVVAQWLALGVPYSLPTQKRRQTKEQRDAASARALTKAESSSVTVKANRQKLSSIQKLKVPSHKVSIPTLNAKQKAMKKAYDKQRREDSRAASGKLKHDSDFELKEKRPAKVGTKSKLPRSGQSLTTKARIPVAPKLSDDQKALARQHRAQLKEQYLDENRESIAQRKAVAKEQRKRFRDEMKKKKQI